jgi:S-methylmethionine-dependent homocysteine/selenocysteine methylase
VTGALASDVLTGSGPVLTDGAIETCLTFELGLELDADLQAAALVGTEALRDLYSGYVTAGREHRLPVVIGTPTFRAGARYAAAAGRDVAEVNAAAVEHHRALRVAAGDGPPILVAGVLGPHGDAYTPADGLDAGHAEHYHALQAGALARAGADFLFAPTFPAVPEALGCVRAMTATGLPAVISWVLDGDGRVLDGTPLAEAIAVVDAQSRVPPLYHSLSCIHPSVADRALRTVRPGRVRQCKANASALAPAQLVALDRVDSEEPDVFARAMHGLHRDHGLCVLGGCCGTDVRHMHALGGLLGAEVRSA